MHVRNVGDFGETSQNSAEMGLGSLFSAESSRYKAERSKLKINASALVPTNHQTAPLRDHRRCVVVVVQCIVCRHWLHSHYLMGHWRIHVLPKVAPDFV